MKETELTDPAEAPGLIQIITTDPDPTGNTVVIRQEAAITEEVPVRPPDQALVIELTRQEDPRIPEQVVLRAAVQATGVLPGPAGLEAPATGAQAEALQGVQDTAGVQEALLADPQADSEAPAAHSEAVVADAPVAEVDPVEEEEDNNLIRLT